MKWGRSLMGQRWGLALPQSLGTERIGRNRSAGPSALPLWEGSHRVLPPRLCLGKGRMLSCLEQPEAPGQCLVSLGDCPKWGQGQRSEPKRQSGVGRGQKSEVGMEARVLGRTWSIGVDRVRDSATGHTFHRWESCPRGLGLVWGLGGETSELWETWTVGS